LSRQYGKCCLQLRCVATTSLATTSTCDSVLCWCASHRIHQRVHHATGNTGLDRRYRADGGDKFALRAPVCIHRLRVRPRCTGPWRTARVSAASLCLSLGPECAHRRRRRFIQTSNGGCNTNLTWSTSVVCNEPTPPDLPPIDGENEGMSAFSTAIYFVVFLGASEPNMVPLPSPTVSMRLGSLFLSLCVRASAALWCCVRACL
jgi:hypothetical protein